MQSILVAEYSLFQVGLLLTYYTVTIALPILFRLWAYSDVPSDRACKAAL